MQDGFIDFSDIRLQRAEVTRYKVRNYINLMYRFLMECDEQEELSIRHDFLRESIYAARSFGLISIDVEGVLFRKADMSFWSRCDELRKENENGC